MSVQENEVLVKITSAGTISIPKQFRKFMDVQKGEYVKMILGKDRLIVRKVTITWELLLFLSDFNRLISPFSTGSGSFYPTFWSKSR